MNLYFLRHAKACARARKWQPDSVRPLTRDGEKRMFKAARGIQALGVSIDLILTSPYLRAFRTAEILEETYGSSKMLETKNLVPEADPKAILGEIHEKFSPFRSIVLVGHEPHLSRLISLLLSGGDGLEIELRKGGFGKMTVERPSPGAKGSLEWLLTCGQLVRIGAKK